jgi:hypothetical protein
MRHLSSQLGRLLSLLLLAAACSSPAVHETGHPSDSNETGHGDSTNDSGGHESSETSVDSTDSGDSEDSDDSSDSSDSDDSGDSHTHDTSETGLVGCDIATLDPYVAPDVWAAPVDPVPGETITIHYDGMLADHSPLTLHYGFNGWEKVGDLSGYVSEASEGDESYYLETPLTFSKDGDWEATVETPDDARALHFEVRDDDDNWDDNDGLDYHQSLDFPYIGPYLTWSSTVGPANGIVVNYETSVPSLGVVAWGPTPDLGSCTVGDARDRIHHIALEGLTAGSTWYYKVYDSLGHASEIHAFQTAQIDDSSFTFLLMGDMQDCGDENHFSDIVDDLLLSHSDVDFVLSTGDLPCWDSPGLWWIFFDKARDLLSTRAIMPALGNHDTQTAGTIGDSAHFRRYFALPFSTDVSARFSFDYGRSHFLALDSSNLDGFEDLGDEYLWAQSDLESCWEGDARRFDRIFSFWHVPPYNAGTRHGSEQERVRGLTALLDGVVDWQFSGHEHMYQRTVPLRYDSEEAPSGEVGIGDDDGVGYLVVPSAGNVNQEHLVPWDSADADRRDLLAYPVPVDGVDVVDSELGFVTVQIDGTSLRIESYGIGTPDDIVPEHLVDSATGD